MDGMETIMIWYLSQRSKYYIDVISRQKPDAKADIRGSAAYPDVIGKANFFQTKDGMLICAEVMGLPTNREPCAAGVFGFHIHEGKTCTGTTEDPFADTKGHDNPYGCKHPYHAGDLPPLFETNGHAFMVVLTGRLTISDIIGKTIVIHSAPDDFTTQPSGNSGRKIACGMIRK